MRILAINDFPQYGGAGQLFMRTNDILKKAGHEVFEITSESDLRAAQDGLSGHQKVQTGAEAPGILKRALTLLPEKIDRKLNASIAHMTRICRHVRYPALARYLRHVLSTRDFDVAHIHNLHTNMSTEVFRILSESGIPVVYQINDYFFFCNSYFAYNKRLDAPCKKCIGGNPLPAWYYGCSQYFGHGVPSIEMARRLVLNLVNPWKHIDSCIVTGGKTGELLAEYGFDPVRIHKSRNPMKLAEFDVPIQSGRSFVFYGFFHAVKGTDTFLKALEYVDSGIDIGYYGLGTPQEYLDRLIATCKRRNLNLTYDCAIEWRKGLREIIAQAYSVVVPSRWWVTSENVVYEGMLLGKAMIVGNAGGNAELIRDGETGMLFDPGDPRSLASKINFLNADRKFGEKIGQKAYEDSRRMFSEEKFLSNLLEIYNTSISAKRGRRKQ